MPRAALVTLGCARNDLDSEELAGRLSAQGWSLVDADSEGDRAPDVIVVNTCGFVEQAKKDSIDTLLAASDTAAATGAKVVAVGCLAERYGAELATSLPEADAVLGFDDYPDIADRLRSILAGDQLHAHTPQDRRLLLPISPVERGAAEVVVPGHGLDEIGSGAPTTGPRAVRRRLDGGPMAPLKLASGCDRRCAFCAIPSFRGS
ncbi:MAG: ribosomal protein methylthiotransferase, partial [Pseudonocardiales bacterium]|nr:ribosomal protein methylthiotransferase [Pseudonocardiales bacterium]